VSKEALLLCWVCRHCSARQKQARVGLRDRYHSSGDPRGDHSSAEGMHTDTLGLNDYDRAIAESGWRPDRSGGGDVRL